MSREAEQMILNRLASKARAESRYAEHLQRITRQREDAERQLENTVAYLVVKKSVTESKAAKLMSVSRDKVRGMVKRANERNRRMMQSGH